MWWIPAILVLSSASAIVSNMIVKNSRDKKVRRIAESVRDVSEIVATVSSLIPMAPKALIKNLLSRILSRI